MAIEIERKFLLKNEDWRAECDSGTKILQGYLNSHKERTVRVRISGSKGEINIKGKTNQLTRQEFEYTIPLGDAEKLILLCETPIIEKTRYRIHQDQLIWEVDEFHGENNGLIVAEVELQSEKQDIDLPNWIGLEVSNDARYYNASLIARPYSKW